MKNHAFHWRLYGSIVLAGAMIGGAYVFGSGAFTSPTAQASMETDLLREIVARDADADGLPDWEESLYGTDPKKADTKGLGMTDGEAVERGLVVPQAVVDIPAPKKENIPLDEGVPPPAAAGSMTDVFARNFFTAYLEAKASTGGAALTKEELSALAESVMEDFRRSVAPAPPFRLPKDLRVQGSGASALEAYRLSVNGVFAAHATTLPKSELEYLADAIEGNSAESLAHIEAISKAYLHIAAGLAALPVPRELAAPMLALINALAQIGRGSADFARFETDPIATMLALGEYGEAVQEMQDALAAAGEVYRAAGIMPAKSAETP